MAPGPVGQGLGSGEEHEAALARMAARQDELRREVAQLVKDREDAFQVRCSHYQ